MNPIEKNIPLPTFDDEVPLEQMEIGDSYLLDFDLLTPRKLQAARLATHLAKYGKKNDQHFLYRTQISGFRIWRDK